MSWLIACLEDLLVRSLADDYLAKATVGFAISPRQIGGAYWSGNTETMESETQGCGTR